MLKFAIGIISGVALGLLIAPAAGEETRQQLARTVKDPKAAAQKQVAEIREKIGDAGARAGRQTAQQAADKVIPESLKQGERGA
jgi:gas vesicle protein